MADKFIRLILVEDHKMVLESLKQLLEESPNIKIIASCNNGTDAIKLAREHRPDIMLIDVNMSPVDGFEATRAITQNDPGIRVIGLSINNQPYYAEKMLESGAMGYLTKSSSFKEMIEAIERVNNGEKYICLEVRNKM